MPKDGCYLLIKLSLREALEEVASGVFEDTGINDEQARDICLYNFHCYSIRNYDNIIFSSTL